MITQLNKVSKMPIQNAAKIKNYFADPYKPITLFNWECPPRYIKYDKTSGTPYISFDVAMPNIAKGVPIDNYTEIPRAVSMKKEESDILKYIKASGINFQFVKLIADTNSRFIYPSSLKYEDSKVITLKKNEFRSLIANSVADYPATVRVYNFWDLLKMTGLQKTYRNLFDLVYKELAKPRQKLLASSIINKQITRTREHIGIKDKVLAKEVAIRTVATYGVEGIILEKLEKTKYMSNCVWFNTEEVSKRALVITNFLRRSIGADPLPMIFPDPGLISSVKTNTSILFRKANYD
ncbi:hypothetical protein A3K34_00945 [candidate division WWE3 bacterium RIFOXYC1_FULL_40_10]|nr:MAG: hypothetical protein A3K58_00945 [candidate division WWE3 bacterium RIFOXYB1_FULL_40_22]OGC61440.1 MAG: hypothetical protein A3K37_00945 [candidate division WWE3 bacterium RIFOXYA1_FULL_40_11]OGC65823.1 MAG: hypothetical protein A3K34_00945 [candidate division WWE3 bacterium RIFOXYC1_FULL_40_10]